jgi:uncharacterized membrane protein YbhN (UPF0104 family)
LGKHIVLGIKIAAAVAFAVIAINVLVNEFSNTTPAEIVRGLGYIGWGTTGIAFVWTILAFTAVAPYDGLALHYAGRKLLFRRSAMSSTTTYAISNLLGFPVFTGNALRLWLYGHWGLGAAEVLIAAIVTTVVCNMVLAMIAGVSLMVEPQAFASIISLGPQWLTALGAALLLLGLALAGFLMFGPKKVSVGSFTFQRPGLLLIPHMLFCVVDYSATAAVLYVLLGSALDMSFVQFVALFSTAKTIGIVSNVPGGLGVFEAVIASTMGSVSAVDLAVALIAYRCIFYLAPFLVAAAFVAVHVLRRASRRTSPRQPSHPSPQNGA